MQHERMEQFIAFCESKPPQKEYHWNDATICALGQFCAYDSRGWENDFAIANSIAREFPWQFGALTERLKDEVLYAHYATYYII